jgi:hypothetical protein
MKAYAQMLLVLALGAAAQKASPPPTGQPPLHTFPPVIETGIPSGASALSTLVTGSSTSATSSSSSSSASVTAANGTSTSTALAAATGHVNLGPILGAAVAVLLL